MKVIYQSSESIKLNQTYSGRIQRKMGKHWLQKCQQNVLTRFLYIIEQLEKKISHFTRKDSFRIEKILSPNVFEDKNAIILILPIIISVMNQSFTKNTNASIINLFEKMDSNITKFRASLSSSPTNRKYSLDQLHCKCLKQIKQRKIQREFYLRQQELVRTTSNALTVQGNETFAKLLLFLSDCLSRIASELNHDIICDCKAYKIQDYGNLMYKITFLREENHKFFKMIQEKTEQCEMLKSKIEQIETNSSAKYQAETPIAVHFKSQMPFASMLSEEITSRMISSNSSRVSEFKHGWPQLTMPLGQVGHRRYFQAPPGNRCTLFDSGEVLQEKSLNHPFESTFRKTKIFEHH